MIPKLGQFLKPKVSSSSESSRASVGGNQLDEVRGPINTKGNTGGASADKMAAAKQTFF